MTPEAGRVLAIDWGERRIGLAISDPLRIIASPAGHLLRRRGKRPPIAKLIDRARELEKRTGFRVSLVDERYSTAAARRAVRELGGRPEERPGDIDALSATVLLQHVLGRSP